MLERRTFIVRVYGHGALPIVEDVATGERVRLPKLASLGEEIERRLRAPRDEAPQAPRPSRTERP